jgi:beta-ribofuranosylaminobenzene 5'-phosphate synthase
MIHITAPSRLHFGLFALPAHGITHWPNAEEQPALPARHFGGVGLMIDQPGVQVMVRSAKNWSATGPSAERALTYGQRFVASLAEDQRQRAFEIVVERTAPEHAGLGAGTQLGLAVARALALATGHADLDAVQLAQRVGRGLRSSLGIHGFQRGGLLVEGGKTASTIVAPLVVREPFPDEWQVLLIMPRGEHGTHGTQERDAFAELSNRDPDLRRTETLCRLVLLGLLPALAERDLPTFGDALYDFNRRVGEMFAPWQGGVYAHPQTAELVSWLRQQGVRGAGQSSWGPAVFAIERVEVLERARQQLLQRGEFLPEELLLCRGANQGAMASSLGSVS